jgi:hypothetical protein
MVRARTGARWRRADIRPGSINDDERNKLRERYRWEVVGPNTL